MSSASVCRCCLARGAQIPLSREPSVREILSLCVDLTVERLPQNVCEECRRVLASFHDFREKARRSDRTLKSYQELPDAFVKEETDDSDCEDSHDSGNSLDCSSRLDVKENTQIFSESQDTCVVQRRKRRRASGYTCEVCGYRAADASSLRVHARFHTGERPFPCLHCAKTFTISSNLKAHLRVHSGERPFVCEVCGRAFPAAASLAGHRRTHTGEKPYRCAICPRAFSLRSNLRQHERTHSGLKPYKCNTCWRAFASSSDARAHRRTHTGERPHACVVCARTFALASNLRKHARVHARQPRPGAVSVCSACGLQYPSKSELAVHARSHAEHKSSTPAQHVCDDCGRRFARKCNLVVHRRRDKSCKLAAQRATDEGSALVDAVAEAGQSRAPTQLQGQNVIVHSQQIITDKMEPPPIRTQIYTTVVPLTLVPISILR